MIQAVLLSDYPTGESVRRKKTHCKLRGTVSHPGKKYIFISNYLVVSVFIILVFDVFSGA